MIGYWFGWPDGQVWPNLLASAICVAVAYLKLRAQSAAQHVETLEQVYLHHLERLEQADKHHKEALAQGERRQDELLAKADGLHGDLKSHVTAVGSHVLTAAVPVPQQLLDDIRNAPRGGERP